MVVARAEDNCDRVADCIWCERMHAGQADLDRAAAALLLSGEACRQCGSIVGDHKITALQQINKARSRQVPDVASAVDNKKFCLLWPLDWQVSRLHRTASCRLRSEFMNASRLPIASASSRAAISGRLSSDRSASG